jgi:ABC-2 type transport system permease protein
MSSGTPATVPVATDTGSGRASSSFVSLYRLVLRLQVTPMRVAGIVALGSLAVLLGALSRSDDEPLRATTEIALGYGLGIVLPLATAWHATSSVGDLVEDRLLVYLWLKPVSRWQLPAAAILATATIVLPLVAVPLVVTAVVAGASQLIGSTLLACALAVVAYAGVFVAVGLWLRRALWWCLLYILVWENGLARAVDGASRLSIASYAQSLVAAKADVVVSWADRGTGASVVAPIVAAVAGLVLAVIHYRRAEID